MSLSDDYLQKHALRGPLINTPPQPGLHCIVTIPAYNESRITTCLDSLFLCNPAGVSAEVIVLVNSPEGCEKGITDVNKKSLADFSDWKRKHQRDDIIFHAVNIENLPVKHAGAGLARKLAMDEAVRRLDQAGATEGIILSLDADATVESNYLSAIVSHFKNRSISGCSIYFEHPLSGKEYPRDVYDAITRYELHIRYYLHAARFSGFPFAYYTVGSCFAVRTSEYCKQGGMNKRQAGEDFYFIQKVALTGRFSDCTSTTVYPSPRPSDRVLFGTGPDIKHQLENPGAPYLTYNFKLFSHLKEFFSEAGNLYSKRSAGEVMREMQPIMRSYLETEKFPLVIEEIRGNAASEKTFVTRFFRHFNMLWVLKFLNYGERKGFGKIEVEKAGRMLMDRLGIVLNETGRAELLKEFRKLDRD